MPEVQDIVKNKIDTTKDTKVDASELLTNISKLTDAEYKDLADNISFNNKEVGKLIEPAIFDVVKANDLLNKKELTVNELKIMKLFFMTVANESLNISTSEFDKYGV